LDIEGISTKSDLFRASGTKAGFSYSSPSYPTGDQAETFFPSNFLNLKISKPNLEFRVIGFISDEDDRLISGDRSDE
jgi:hypothetical protein